MTANQTSTTFVGRLAIVSVALALAATASSNDAEAALVLQFNSGGNDIQLMNNGDGTSTFQAGPIAIGVDSFYAPADLSNATIEFLNVKSNSATVFFNNKYFQSYAGAIQVKNGVGDLLLKATFSNISVTTYELSGGGITAELTFQEPPESVVFQSDFPGLFLVPRGVAISFGLKADTFSTSGNTISFIADGFSGEFLAEIDTAEAIPEPGTIAMALTALPLMGLGYYVRRRGRA